MGNGKRLGRILRQYQSGKITKEYLKELLKSGVLGRVVGKIGPFVVRYRNGKPIVSERPLFVKKSMSAASVQGRNNFASKVKFAKFLNNIDEIRTVWQNAEIEGCSSYSRLISYNNIKNILPTHSNYITPPKYHFEINSMCSLNNEYNLLISGYSDAMIQDTLLAVIVPYNTVSKTFEMIFIKSPAASGEIVLSEEQKEICRKYSNFIIYQAVIRNNINGLEWSNTHAGEVTISTEAELGSENNNVFCFLLFTMLEISSAEYFYTARRGGKRSPPALFLRL